MTDSSAPAADLAAATLKPAAVDSRTKSRRDNCPLRKSHASSRIGLLASPIAVASDLRVAERKDDLDRRRGQATHPGRIRTWRSDELNEALEARPCIHIAAGRGGLIAMRRNHGAWLDQFPDCKSCFVRPHCGGVAHVDDDDRRLVIALHNGFHVAEHAGVGSEV